MTKESSIDTVDKNLLTIVIPFYNRADLLACTLDYLDVQLRQDWDIILVDNNSTDHGADVARRWCDKRNHMYGGNGVSHAIFLTESRPGASAARQAGLDLVDTPWTMFFDSDDYMSPGHLKRALGAIEANPDAELIGWPIAKVPARPGFTIQQFLGKNTQYDSLFHGGMGTQRYCARTDLFRRAGGWDPSVSVWDDIELGARILALDPQIVRLTGTPTAKTIIRPDSITNGESMDNIANIDIALNKISATLGESRGPLWTDLKRTVIAALSHTEAGDELYRKICARQSHPAIRMIWTLYHHHIPGGLRLIKPFV